MRKDIERVGADSCCARDLRESHQSPGRREPNNWKRVLESLAVEHHGANSKSTRGIDSPKTILGIVLALVGLDVEILEEVIEEMTPEFANYCSNDWGKVEERGLSIVEGVGRRADELGDSGYDADGPGEKEHDIKSWVLG